MSRVKHDPTFKLSNTLASEYYSYFIDEGPKLSVAQSRSSHVAGFDANPGWALFHDASDHTAPSQQLQSEEQEWNRKGESVDAARRRSRADSQRRGGISTKPRNLVGISVGKKPGP